MLKKENKINWFNVIILYLPFLILLFFLKAPTGHDWDTSCWERWAIFSFENGVSNIYKSWNDYLPLYHYFLYFFGLFQGSTEAISQNINSLKNITLFFEFASTLFLFKMHYKKYNDIYKSLFFSLFYLLNISVVYNTLIWGQVDGIMAFFVFASVYFGLKKKLFATLLFFILAINMKLQAIIFAPIIILLLIPMIFQDNFKLKNFILSILGIIAIQFLIILPFIIAGDFSTLWKNVILGSVGRFSVISMNAYNLWYIIFDADLQYVTDTTKFIGLSYKNWGLILFFLSAFFALFHFIKPAIQRIFKKNYIEFSDKKVFISCALIPLLFFFFNTQMHERYSFPALIFLAAYAILYKKPIPYILVSIAFFLNMEDVLRYFEFGNYHTLVYQPYFVACIYLLAIILLYLDLYNVRLFRKKKNIETHNYSYNSI